MKNLISNKDIQYNSKETSIKINLSTEMISNTKINDSTLYEPRKFNYDNITYTLVKKEIPALLLENIKINCNIFNEVDIYPNYYSCCDYITLCINGKSKYFSESDNKIDSIYTLKDTTLVIDDHNVEKDEKEYLRLMITLPTKVLHSLTFNTIDTAFASSNGLFIENLKINSERGNIDILSLVKQLSIFSICSNIKFNPDLSFDYKFKGNLEYQIENKYGHNDIRIPKFKCSDFYK